MPGWKILPFKLKTDFHGEVVEKILVINHWKTMIKLISSQVGQFIQNRSRDVRYRTRSMRYDVENFGMKVMKRVKNNHANAIDLSVEIEEELVDSNF